MYIHTYTPAGNLNGTGTIQQYQNTYIHTYIHTYIQTNIPAVSLDDIIDCCENWRQTLQIGAITLQNSDSCYYKIIIK